MSTWKPIFALAALFNAVFAGLLILAPKAVYVWGGVPVPSSLLEARFLGWCIACFAIGYAFTAVNPAANRDFVRTAVIGKFGVFALVAAHWAEGLAPIGFLGPVAGDLIWALVFLLFLYRGPVSLVAKGVE